MGVYRKLCYFVEDIFVKMLTKNQDAEVVKAKVNSYRNKWEEEKLKKKKVMEEKVAAIKKEREAQLQKEKEATLKLLSKVVDVDSLSYTQYEFNEVKNNKHFFESMLSRVFEEGEKGLTFLGCEFDKSSKKEIRGYLIVTNKRMYFLNKNLTFMDKFRYQTVINVSWFRDGLIEKGLYIQYGKKRLEFDEIFDAEQMKRVGNLILNLSSNKVKAN